ncbi:PIH1 domain-containing protein 2 [Gymnogyps californianus]|uniref:PIH1 domain-containing protein 2 n=1 Tax=Gymnogyps californianus TaxID=33616 RepID=UPI0021C62D05|nr:PIH1 domain-containing protein 2 [Gymnogyps californianus]
MAGAALARAAQLWSLLDEMAENEPQAYRRLLRQQRAEAERFCAPPEPHLCLRARPAVGARGLGLGLPPGRWERGLVRGPLFINVCSWKNVPPPKAPTDPAPVSAGPLEEVSGEGELYSIIDIAYNPDVLQRGEENPEKMEHLIHLTLKFVEERCNLILSYLYTIESFKLKGSLEMMQQRLKGRQMTTPHLSQIAKKELTLDQLLHTMEAEDCSNAPVLLKEESVTQSKAHLIEEITSTEMPEKPSTPVYEMITVKDANKKPLKIELRIELPKVSSVSECDLKISKDDLIIEVPEKYKLQLDLPELVDEETTTAVFNKGKRVLFITVPVAKPDP